MLFFRQACQGFFFPSSGAPLHMPPLGHPQVLGDGVVPAGRGEQCSVKPGELLVFLPDPCTGLAFTAESQRMDQACPVLG